MAVSKSKIDKEKPRGSASRKHLLIAIKKLEACVSTCSLSFDFFGRFFLLQCKFLVIFKYRFVIPCSNFYNNFNLSPSVGVLLSEASFDTCILKSSEDLRSSA